LIELSVLGLHAAIQSITMPGLDSLENTAPDSTLCRFFPLQKVSAGITLAGRIRTVWKIKWLAPNDAPDFSLKSI
jgi:hypothetical protein